MFCVSLSDQAHDEQGELELIGELGDAMQHVVDHHRLLKTGQRKMVVIIENGLVRKVIIELSMSPSVFEGAAT